MIAASLVARVFLFSPNGEYAGSPGFGER